MTKTPKKVYERVYIHAAKVLTKEGWVLVIHSMEGMSQFAYDTVFSKSTEITLDVLNQVFDNVLKDYRPVFHPRQIVFVTNLSEEHDYLIQQTKAKRHRFVYNKELTQKAVKELIDSMSYKMHEL